MDRASTAKVILFSPGISSRSIKIPILSHVRANSPSTTQTRNYQYRHTVVLQSLGYAGLPGQAAAHLNKDQNY